MLNAGDFNLILLAEKRLGLPVLFYFKLTDIKDDWALILKLHALFEGTLHKLLAEKATQFEFSEPLLSERDSFYRMVETAARIFLPDKQTEGYVPAREYLLALNHLRNRITHDLRFINLNMDCYVASLSELEFQRAARSLAISFPDVSLNAPEVLPTFSKLISTLLQAKPPRHRLNTLREFFFNYSAKASIWSGGGAVLSSLSVCLHIQPIGNSLETAPRTAATLQDLLHDPAVLEYKRELSKEFGIDLT